MTSLLNFLIFFFYFLNIDCIWVGKIIIKIDGLNISIPEWNINWTNETEETGKLQRVEDGYRGTLSWRLFALWK